MTNVIDWRYVLDEFVVIDFETTGLDASIHKIIEVGALRFNKNEYKKNKKVDTFQSLIKIEEQIPQKITDITGITDDMLVEGRLIGEVLSDLIDFIGERNVLAYNAPFDYSFLLEECKNNKIKIPKNFKINCILDLAREALPGMPNYKLDTLSKKMGLNGARHRALDDCSVALQIFVACFQGSGARGRYVERFGYIDVIPEEKKISGLGKLFKKLIG